MREDKNNFFSHQLKTETNDDPFNLYRDEKKEMKSISDYIDGYMDNWVLDFDDQEIDEYFYKKTKPTPFYQLSVEEQEETLKKISEYIKKNPKIYKFKRNEEIPYSFFRIDKHCFILEERIGKGSEGSVRKTSLLECNNDHNYYYKETRAVKVYTLLDRLEKLDKISKEKRLNEKYLFFHTFGYHFDEVSYPKKSYVDMELIPGKPISNIDFDLLSFQEVIEMSIQAHQKLKLLHDDKIAHLDLANSNNMHYCPDSKRFIILDFGISEENATKASMESDLISINKELIKIITKHKDFKSQKQEVKDKIFYIQKELCELEKKNTSSLHFSGNYFFRENSNDEKKNEESPSDEKFCTAFDDLLLTLKT